MEIDNHPLKVDDYIYINKLNNKYRVYEVVRSTNNEYVYYVDYCIPLIIDEVTEKSKQEAEKLLSQYQKEFGIKKSQQKNEVYSSSLNKKKWYQFWR